MIAARHDRMSVSRKGLFRGGDLAFGPVGYELRVDGAVVGAVQTINGGAVWIEASASPEVRQAAALASATLLLYQSIDS